VLLLPFINICAGGSAITRRKQKKKLLWNSPVSDVGFWCVFVFIVVCALGHGTPLQSVVQPLISALRLFHSRFGCFLLYVMH
jgi:hypothetical protein